MLCSGTTDTRPVVCTVWAHVPFRLVQSLCSTCPRWKPHSAGKWRGEQFKGYRMTHCLLSGP